MVQNAQNDLCSALMFQGWAGAMIQLGEIPDIVDFRLHLLEYAQAALPVTHTGVFNNRSVADFIPDPRRRYVGYKAAIFNFSNSNDCVALFALLRIVNQ